MDLAGVFCPPMPLGTRISLSSRAFAVSPLSPLHSGKRALGADRDIFVQVYGCQEWDIDEVGRRGFCALARQPFGFSCGGLCFVYDQGLGPKVLLPVLKNGQTKKLRRQDF